MAKGSFSRTRVSVLSSVPHAPRGEQDRTDHQQDSNKRSAWRVIGVPDVNAGDANGNAEGDDADCFRYIPGRGFHEASFLKLKTPPAIQANYHITQRELNRKMTVRKGSEAAGYDFIT